MDVIGYETYLEITDKTFTSNIPSVIALRKTLNTMDIFFYPVPNKNIDLTILWVRDIADIVNNADYLDLPVDFINAITYQLAKNLSHE